MILRLLMSMIKHSQSTQMSLCNISKKVRNGVHFLYADRRQGCIIDFDGNRQTPPKYLK